MGLTIPLIQPGPGWSGLGSEHSPSRAARPIRMLLRRAGEWLGGERCRGPGGLDRGQVDRQRPTIAARSADDSSAGFIARTEAVVPESTVDQGLATGQLPTFLPGHCDTLAH